MARLRGLRLEPARSGAAQFAQPLKLRQQRLGHSDPSLTLGVYTHVVSEDDERFAQQLDFCANAPKNENGSGVESRKPLYLS
jgi:hypothetical protein